MAYVRQDLIIKAYTDLLQREGKIFTTDVTDALMAVPAEDVVPVRHGRWIISRTDRAWNGAEFPTHCKCDQCGREIPYLDADAYCPACGALMDKDGDL